MPYEPCPRCGQRVEMNVDGTCPSCGSQITTGEDDPFGMPPPSSFDDEIRRSRGDRRDADLAPNPYESPFAEEHYAGDDAATKPFGAWLLWVLFSFEGRIPRRVYWGATLLSMVGFWVLMFLMLVLSGVDPDSETADGLLLIVQIPMIWTSVAIAVKRWHDRDKSGWWILIGLVPIIGWIWQFIENGCLRGTVGPNRYGPDPT